MCLYDSAVGEGGGGSLFVGMTGYVHFMLNFAEYKGVEGAAHDVQNSLRSGR
jgi:hypothetical protein